MTVVVDTNVILTANGQHAGVSEACIVACARRLRAIMTAGRVAIDEDYRILQEYQHRTTPLGSKRPGDVFVKWLLRNQANPARCDRVPLRTDATRGFESFPDDARLTTFDWADRKFVAVACAHRERPPIAQATDSKWLAWAPALRDHGVDVEFLCPGDIRSFDDRKKRRKRRAR